MATLSYAQLKAVWLSASEGTRYHTNAWASLMAAIAEAESGGNPLATNPTDNGGTQTSWGLWQISLGNHAAPSPNWASPEVNARLAIGKLDSQGLQAWGTYNSGAYRGFLSDKTAADVSGLSAVDTSTAATSAATTAATTQADCAWKLGIPWLGSVCLLSNSQVRALVGVSVLLAGGVVMAGGIVLIAAEVGLKLGGPLALAAAVPEADAVAAAGSAAQPRPSGTRADRRGTSPEFRRQFGLSA